MTPRHRYEPALERDGRWRILDRRFGDYVENGKGNVRRFYTMQAADRFAEALNRGVRRPVGTRA